MLHPLHPTPSSSAEADHPSPRAVRRRSGRTTRAIGCTAVALAATLLVSCGSDGTSTIADASPTSADTDAATAATAATADTATGPSAGGADGADTTTAGNPTAATAASSDERAGTAVLTIAGQTIEFEHTHPMVPCTVAEGDMGFITFSGTNAAGEELKVEWAADYPDDGVIRYVTADADEWEASTIMGRPVDVLVSARGRATATADLNKLYSNPPLTEAASVEVSCA
jgi:hypothetical protein